MRYRTVFQAHLERLAAPADGAVMEKFHTHEVAGLLAETLKRRSLQDIAGYNTALYRRLYDITHGKTETVTLPVFDQLCVATGHVEWLQVLEPV